MTDSTAVNSEHDVSAIQHSEWPARELGHLIGVREACFQVVYKQSVLDEIHLHGQSAPAIEVCGVLVGTGYQDARGPYLLIEHCIRGNNAGSKATNVTFTADTWQHIQETMDRQYADKKIVGWYHTHPGFGIFLSDMDIFICDHFFDLPWQSAFVYDPISGEEGNFIWRAGRPEKDPVLVENDVTPAAAAIPLISTRDAMSGDREWASPPDPRVIELRARVRRLERRQKVMFYLLAFFAAFVALWATKFTPLPPGLSSSAKSATQPATQPTTQSAAPSLAVSHSTGPLIIEAPDNNATEVNPLKPRGQ
jgi:proteasome lid subunit RPN8/RPN11